jgi:hypothetical protein
VAVVDTTNALVYRGRLSNDLGRTDQIQAIRDYCGHLALAADACQQCDPLYTYGIDLARLG